MANKSYSSPSFVCPTVKGGLRTFSRIIIIIENTKLQLQSVSNVSYSTGRITMHNQIKRLFTCLIKSSLPQHQRKQYPLRIIIQTHNNPSTDSVSERIDRNYR